MTEQSPRGVLTNGIGNRTTAHLNLEFSLADKPYALGLPAPKRHGRRTHGTKAAARKSGREKA